MWCLKKEGGPGAVPPGKFFIFLPKTMGFYKISCARKITKQKKPLPDERLKNFLKSRVFGRRIDEAQNVRQLFV